MNAQDMHVRNDTLRWSEQNQRWLVQQLALLRERVARGNAADSATATPANPSTEDATPSARAATFVPALEQLVSLFGLTRFEREVLLLAAGVELDAALRRMVREALGGKINFALALDKLSDAHWDAVAPQAPLRFWRLIGLEPRSPLTEAELRIDERVLHYLTGVAAIDERLQGIAQTATRDHGVVDSRFANRVARILDGAARQPALLVLHRDDASGWAEGEVTAAATLRAIGLDALVTRIHDWPADPRELSEAARLLDREAALNGAAVIIHLDALCEHAQEHELRTEALIAKLRSHVLLLGKPSRELLAALPMREVHRLPLPTSSTDIGPRRADATDAMQRALKRALQQFRLPPAQLQTAISSVQSAPDSDETDAAHTDNIVWQALREAARGGLDALAQRIDSRTTFADLILPPAPLATLRDITRQLRQRERVYQEWGFAEVSARGLGLCALFAGESGTGKTMAAEAIANEAQLDLYRIDLATVVSKYIGETEKNLKRLFDAAEASGAVLLFDEADALFGKRSEVKDSHDRYANIEIAYLLQRIEAYRGLAILTTNMKSALDRAFLRRIRFVVQFPFPDARAREELWRRQFPAQAPVNGVDYAALAKLQLAGGNIRSIAINAAFKAADQDCTIGQRLLVEAARAEYAKLERSGNELGEIR